MPDVELKQEKAKLKRVLRRWDLVFFSVCAIISLDAIAGVAKFGLWQGVTWFVIFVFLFLLPYGLISAELASTFPVEGGIYSWVRMAYGKLPAGITAILYWIANPIWIGGTLAGVSIAAINAFYMEPNGHADLGWLASIVHRPHLRLGEHRDLRRFAETWQVGGHHRDLRQGHRGDLLQHPGRRLPDQEEHALRHAPLSGLKPSATGFLAVIGSIVFLLVGFELESGASEEMVNPQRDVPIGVLRSGAITAILYIMVVAGILLALPQKTLSASSGFTGAFQAVNQGVFGTGTGAKFLGYVFAIIIILTLISSGSVWILGSCRVEAMAALDGAAPRILGRFSKQGTPIAMAVLSGFVGSFFVIYIFAVLKGSLTSFFSVMLSLALSTAVLCYLFSLPACITLRKKFPDVRRPFRVPGGTVGLWISVTLSEICVILTGFTLLWPGFIDKYLLGQSYSIMDSWGVGRTFFEEVTFGSFIVIVLVAVVFWAWGTAESKGMETTDEDLIGSVVKDA